jgi:V/A-type H+-transporting ATPase subunit D
MSRLRGQPPGRAGLTWLRHRLGLAHRAAARLDQKLRILRTEQAAFALLLERSALAWSEASRDAETWLLRAALLGGEEGVRPPAGQPPAEVSITWTNALGTTYPSHGTCTSPPTDPRMASVAPAGLVEASAAYRRALQAAMEHAVASSASRAIDAEVTMTRQRLRGVQDRWVPRLASALHELTLGLEETELAEHVRLRWAADRDGAGR